MRMANLKVRTKLLLLVAMGCMGTLIVGAVGLAGMKGSITLIVGLVILCIAISFSVGLYIANSITKPLKSVLDILQSKLVKRGVSLKALSYGPLEAALGGTVRQKITLQQGISSEKAKEIAKAIRDAKFKAQTQIQGDQVRVLSKDKDELQAVIAFLKGQDFNLPLQFTNYR